jgi:hypothetical protein
MPKGTPAGMELLWKTAPPRMRPRLQPDFP